MNRGWSSVYIETVSNFPTPAGPSGGSCYSALVTQDIRWCRSHGLSFH